MIEEKLKNIVKQGEGYYVEFKQGLSKDLAKEIVAFANASGGSMYLELRDYPKQHFALTTSLR